MLHVKIYKKVQAEARSLDPDSFHYTRQLNVRLGDSTQGRQRHPFTYYHPISIWAAKFLCDSSTGTARFVVLHFILLHRCWFFFFRDGRQDPLPAKRLQLALLRWPQYLRGVPVNQIRLYVCHDDVLLAPRCNLAGSASAPPLRNALDLPRWSQRAVAPALDPGAPAGSWQGN